MNGADLILSFIVTWTIILVPPSVLRFIRRKPFSKAVAVVFSIALYFANIVLMVMLGSQSKTHAALLIGALACYYILRWETEASSIRAMKELRKAQGYDQ